MSTMCRNDAIVEMMTFKCACPSVKGHLYTERAGLDYEKCKADVNIEYFYLQQHLITLVTSTVDIRLSRGDLTTSPDKIDTAVTVHEPGSRSAVVCPLPHFQPTYRCCAGNDLLRL